LLRGPKVIVCDVVPVMKLTMKLWVTGGAGAKVALPAWLAVIEQFPAATIVTIVTVELDTVDTVQTAVVVELKVTSRPEEAVALMVNGATPNVTGLNRLNAIVCEVLDVRRS
jgi:hypothetical protein